MAHQTVGLPFRQIRAVHDKSTVRVYQAYSKGIADAAVIANSFQGPLDKGLWSKTRMTWIKPSAVWMGYRCGWTTMKDKRQARVLALDISRPAFEKLLLSARLSHTRAGSSSDCRDGSVVVQWDPERELVPRGAGGSRKEVYTAKMAGGNVRSIQIGLRGTAVQMLLDPTIVLKITDVTAAFASTGAALLTGNMTAASMALWGGKGFVSEREYPCSAELRAVLAMGVDAPQTTIGSAERDGKRTCTVCESRGSKETFGRGEWRKKRGRQCLKCIGSLRSRTAPVCKDEASSDALLARPCMYQGLIRQLSDEGKVLLNEGSRQKK